MKTVAPLCKDLSTRHTLFHSREPCLEIQSKGHGILEDRGLGREMSTYSRHCQARRHAHCPQVSFNRNSNRKAARGFVALQPAATVTSSLDRACRPGLPRCKDVGKASLTCHLQIKAGLSNYAVGTQYGGQNSPEITTACEYLGNKGSRVELGTNALGHWQRHDTTKCAHSELPTVSNPTPAARVTQVNCSLEASTRFRFAEL